jgi:hypothetical protein
MKHLALLFACACACGLLHGQVTAVQAELVADHNTTGIAELAGMKTYHVFAQMSNEADEISAVFGDISAPLSIASTEAFYQSDLGANFGWNINASVLAFFPDVNYDSWLTIGVTDSNSSTLANSIGLEAGFAGFNSGGDFVVDDAIGGSVFTLFGDENAAAGEDLKVLIAQLTTAGEISGIVNIQMFIDGMQNQSMQAIGLPILMPQGCGDEAACNYDPTFGPETLDDCVYPDSCSDCNGECLDANANSVCDCDEFIGCTNPAADNYDASASADDGSCILGGCIYINAANYNPDATYDDESCVFAGCTNALALNFDPTAILEDGSCLLLGCMDPVGLNFDPIANVSGACDYSVVCMSDLDGDGYVDVFDLLLMFESYGYDCE